MKANIKFQIINRYAVKYPITAMCFLKVSRSGYYSYVERMDEPDRNMPLLKLIEECYHSGRYMHTYDCRRVQIWLEREKGLHYNYKTIWRAMRKYGILANIRRKRL